MTNEQNDKLPGPVSRRDFLRRAGKEAVTTGTNLVPGAKLATAALGVAKGKTAWWERLVKWRESQQTEAIAEQTAQRGNSHES